MGDITLRKALDDYKTVYMPYRNFAERTRVEYLNDLEDLVEHLEKSGVHEVEKLELGHIERYLAKLERRGFADATRKRKTITIRSFLKFLYQDGYIESNLAKQIIPPFVDNKAPTFLTEIEYNRLRKACAGNVRDAAIVELLLQTGIKLSELTRLTTDDIDLQDDRGFIRVRGGIRKEDRILPLNSKASQAIKTYLSQRKSEENPILFLNRFGEPIGERGIQKMVRKHLETARIERASVHTLRHTFAAHHVAKGTSIKTIQEIMGHKDKRSTSLYISIASEVIKKELQNNVL